MLRAPSRAPDESNCDFHSLAMLKKQNGRLPPSGPAEDIVKTELSLGFWATGPLNAQYVSLAAPLGFAFLEQSFSPGEGGRVAGWSCCRAPLLWFLQKEEETSIILGGPPGPQKRHQVELLSFWFPLFGP